MLIGQAKREEAAQKHAAKMIARLGQNKCPICNKKIPGRAIKVVDHEVRVRPHFYSIEKITIRKPFTHVNCKHCQQEYQFAFTSRSKVLTHDEIRKRVKSQPGI